MSHLPRGLVNVNLQINHLDLQTAPTVLCHPYIDAALPFSLSQELWAPYLQPLLAPVYGTCQSGNSVGLAQGKAQGDLAEHKSRVL